VRVGIGGATGSGAPSRLSVALAPDDGGVPGTFDPDAPRTLDVGGSAGTEAVASDLLARLD
jgi:hypothetical protein